MAETLTICPKCGDKDYRNIMCRRCRDHIRKIQPGPNRLLDRLDESGIDGLPEDAESAIRLLEQLRGKANTAPIGDEELKGMAVQGFNMFKRDVERGHFNFLLASYHVGQGIHRMSMIEAEIIERLGENWLDSGRTKDIGFRILRLATRLLPPDAVIIATIINRFSATEKIAELSREQQEELLRASHDRHHQAVKDGYLKVCDALMVCAQTPERVCLCHQDIDRRLRPIGASDTKFWDQDGFDGRLKMYGKCTYDSED